MKSILLATASILAFAGAAAAEVTFGGSATLGFNIDNGEEPRDDGDTDDFGEGFFYEADLGVTLSQELNNGLTAAVTFTLNIEDEDEGSGEVVNVDDEFLLSLTAGETGGLFFGDTAFAAESRWDAAGNMLADRFSEQDGETVLRGDTIFNGIETSISYVVADAEDINPEDDLDQLSIGASGAISTFTYSVAYQEESEIADDLRNGAPFGPYAAYDDFEISEVFAISAGTTFGGIDAQAAYATDRTFEDSSLGFEVTAPFGPVTLGAYYVLEENDASDFDPGFDDIENSLGVSADYVSGPLTVSAFYEIEDDNNDDDDPDRDETRALLEAANPGLSDAEIDALLKGTDAFENEGDDDNENSNYGIEVGYESNFGAEFYAGYVQENGGYIGVEYDLGNGAEIIASYAEEDEEGAREYEGGTTVALSLEF